MLRVAPATAIDDVASAATALVPGDWLDVADRAIDLGNGVPVWGGVSVVLGITGAAGRRSALVGAVAAAAASATSNGVVKPMVHRRRPRTVAPHRTQSTSSFPSSHAATGAALGTAAALTWRPSILLTAPVVAAVAFSRVHARHHRLSEVAAGAVLGVAVGAVVGTVARRAVKQPSTS